MIQGQVSAAKHITIRVLLLDPAGQSSSIEATVDTGFDDFLTVTPQLAAALQMPYLMTRDYELGDGSIVPFDVHWARVSWDSQDRLVEALVTDGGVLIGMAMLHGYTLFADVVDGGEVRIEVRA